MSETWTVYDAAWRDRPESVCRTSVLGGGYTCTSTLYHPTYGGATTVTVNGWTLDDQGQVVAEQHVTSHAYYNGAEGAAFNPGGWWDGGTMSAPQPAGMPLSTDGPRTDVTDVTTYVYYPTSYAVVAARGQLAAVRDALDHDTLFEDYDAWGNARKVTDPNGVVTLRSFDAVGRILTSTAEAAGPTCGTAVDPLCNTNLTTTSTYQGAGALGPLATTTTSGQAATTIGYGDYGRVETVDRGPAGEQAKEQSLVVYDANTHLRTSESKLVWGGSSWVEKARTEMDYDPLSGQLTTVTRPRFLRRPKPERGSVHLRPGRERQDLPGRQPRRGERQVHLRRARPPVRGRAARRP